jgi:hypothetical protein
MGSLRLHAPLNWFINEIQTFFLKRLDDDDDDDYAKRDSHHAIKLAIVMYKFVKFNEHRSLQLCLLFDLQ